MNIFFRNGIRYTKDQFDIFVNGAFVEKCHRKDLAVVRQKYPKCIVKYAKI